MSGKEGANASKAKTTGSSANTAQPRTSHKPVAIHTQAEKRPNTDMDTSSFGDELTMINKQLEQLSDDSKEMKEKVSDMLTKAELKDFIRETVDQFVRQLEVRIEREIEQKVKDRTIELNDRLDSLTFDNVELKEQLEKMMTALKNNESLAQKAIEKSNDNEQYSRKNNIKIMGVPEQGTETIENLSSHVCNILRTRINLAIDPQNIEAIHRIPGKPNNPRPVLVKMRNNHEKTKIMRKRREMKELGYRLVDDVTKLNTELIGRLSHHEHISSAWFFNGNIYGKTSDGKRHKFGLHSNISQVIHNRTDRMEVVDCT